MRRSLATLLLLLVTGFAFAAAAGAAIPDDDGPAPSDDGTHPNRVHKLKPWKARFEYRMSRNANVHDELNGRADTIAGVLKDQWWPIDCQLVSQTQNGPVLWNRIPGVGWVADSAMQTFRDGRLEGSPTCANPAPNHVWFKQDWSGRKQYRLNRDVQLSDRPDGAPIAKTLPAKSWTALNCFTVSGGKGWFLVDPSGPTSGYIPADGVALWQNGAPAKMPRCARQTQPPIRTYAAIGDSYASGLGTPGDNIGGGCRRSPDSYFGLLRGSLKNGITTADDRFQACAGDTSKDVRAGQMDALDPTTRVVTLSAGGNDFHFPLIVKKCVTPGGDGCDDAVAEYVGADDVKRVRRDLKRLYTNVRREAPYAKVYVMGYPEIVDRKVIDGCGSLSAEDGPLLHRTATRVNGTIRKAIGNRRGFRFVGLVTTFKDHPACNKNSTDWINGVVGGDADRSFHPNTLGHDAIARRLRAVAPQYFG